MSKFSGLFEEAKKDKNDGALAPELKRTRRKEMPPAEIKTPTRIKGRRSNPEYTGAFAYIPAKLHENVRRELFGRKDTDFSGLVEQLLTDWITKEKRQKS